MAQWTFTQTRGSGGRHVIVFSAPGQAPTEVTHVRAAPAELRNYSFTDPFGYAAATIAFPMLTGFDDLGSGGLAWLHDDANIDIWWLPAEAGGEVVDALTQDYTVAADSAGKVKVWEGFVASWDLEPGDDGDVIVVEGLGALFQADGYRAKPGYPSRPVPFEHLIRDELSPAKRPHLRTRELVIDWPAGWSKIVTRADVDNPTVFTPKGLKVGDKHTGYATRQTGSWDNALTSYIQDLLATMFVDDESGVTPGNQWTLTCEEGRKPVMRVRDRTRAPDFTVAYGQVGVKVTLSHDLTERTDVVFGEGTGLNGVNWRNAAISPTGETTAYVPLAHGMDAYPTISTNPSLNPQKIIRESFTKFAPGIDQAQGTLAAGKILQRDRNAGYTGTLELKVDPPGMSRWQIKAGMVVNIQHVLGSGEQGLNLHINEVVCNTAQGIVTCKVDSKFRDLLTFEEAVARARDPLLPSRLLQINRRSVLIEDQMAPWDYGAGSGLIPLGSKPFWRDLPPAEAFPWRNQTVKYKPGAYPEWYVRVNADAPYRKDRWTRAPILMSEKGTIRRIEVTAVDRWGEPVLCQFHLSLYYTSGIDAMSMPFDALGPSPFIKDAFQDTTDTGAPLPPGAYLTADPSLIIGWGDSDQPAGHSPGAYSEGYPVTGLLIDDSTWTFDCTNNPDFDQYARASARQPQSAVMIYAMFYAEFTEDVYFIGRMYNQPQGSA